MLRGLFRAISAVVGLLLLVWLISFVSVFIFSRKDQAAPADAIVVLGAAQYDGRPSPVLKARLDHAVELYRRDLANLLIVTGGVGVGDTVSEAQVGRRYAIDAGIPGDRILLESSGVSSVESMAGVADLLEDRDLGSVILVSDPFHMLRLELLARHYNLEAHSSPTNSSPIEARSRGEMEHMLRESLILPFALLGIS